MGLKYANFYISYNFFKILNPFPKHFYNSGQRLAWLYWNDISCPRVYTVWYWIELFKSIIHESVQSVIALFYNTHNTWNNYCVVTPCLKSDYSCCNKVALNPLILCTHESQTWIQKFLKEINGAFSVTLLCKSNWFFFYPFPFPWHIHEDTIWHWRQKWHLPGTISIRGPSSVLWGDTGVCFFDFSFAFVGLESRRSEPLCLLWNNRNWFFNFLLLSSTIGKTWTNMVTDMYMYKRNTKHRPTNSYYIYKCSCVCKQTYRSYNINHLLTNK